MKLLGLSRRIQRQLSVQADSDATANVPSPSQQDYSALMNSFAVNQVKKGRVYYVATPIGNLGDVTLRALNTLKEVDIIYAEDTRNTMQLLRHYNISYSDKQIISHHEHNENQQQIDDIITKCISNRYSIAVVSDAGTPGISDPGAPLARALGLNSVQTHPIPGPSAVISALSISGYGGSEFSFFGFIPVKGKEKTRKFQSIYQTSHAIVFYEAPHRILRTFSILADQTKDKVEGIPPELAGKMKNRECIVCRELTKRYEEIKRGTVFGIFSWLKELDDSGEKKNEHGGIRGEFVVILGPYNTEDDLG